MGNLRSNMTDEEWDKLEESLIGEKHSYDKDVKDEIVDNVRQDLLNRSEIGIKKYNKTLDRNDLDLKDWLQHAYEECLDQALYLKRAIKELN